MLWPNHGLCVFSVHIGDIFGTKQGSLAPLQEPKELHARVQCPGGMDAAANCSCGTIAFQEPYAHCPGPCVPVCDPAEASGTVPLQEPVSSDKSAGDSDAPTASLIGFAIPTTFCSQRALTIARTWARPFVASQVLLRFSLLPITGCYTSGVDQCFTITNLHSWLVNPPTHCASHPSVDFRRVVSGPSP